MISGKPSFCYLFSGFFRSLCHKGDIEFLAKFINRNGVGGFLNVTAQPAIHIPVPILEGFIEF